MCVLTHNNDVSEKREPCAEDVSLDTPLALMCDADRARLCNETGWGGGVTEQCLKERRGELSIKCKLEAGLYKLNPADPP
jgi:hypothetical protein